MTLTFVAGRLHKDGQPVPFVPTHKKSRARTNPRFIVIHDTASGPGAGGDIHWLTKGASGGSAHFVIAEDGEITQLAELTEKTWHAGESTFRGLRYLNAWSVGIELDNPGLLIPQWDGVASAWFHHKGGNRRRALKRDARLYDVVADDLEYYSEPTHDTGYYKPYPGEQLEACEALCAAIRAELPQIEEITGHYVISPGRKIDPTPAFDLAALNDLVIGNDTERAEVDDDVLQTGDRGGAVSTAQWYLKRLGYHMMGKADGIYGKRTMAAVRAFEDENGLAVDGTSLARRPKNSEQQRCPPVRQRRGA